MISHSTRSGFGRMACARLVAAMAGLILLGWLPLAAEPMPEFGSSVQFDKGGPEVSIARLKGKAVIVIFFQSWCGICNGWSPKLIKGLEEAYGSNRAVVMVALKTDGGGVGGAKSYLKSAGADLTKWCVGSDDGAAFFKQVNGKDDLWRYALVGANGDLVERGEASSHYKEGPFAGKYALATSKALKDCGAIGTVLPADKNYPPDAANIVRLAEFGCLGKALSLCNSSQSGLKQDIQAVLEQRLRQRMDVVKDAAKDGPSRYEAYKELVPLVKECPSGPLATEANGVLSKANSAPVIQRERSAESEYVAVQRKMQRASKRDVAKLMRELEAIGKKYEGTKFGQLAAAQSQPAATQ